MKRHEIHFITSNQGKIKSLENSLKLQNIDVTVLAKNLDIMEPQFDSVQEVSKFKAETAFKIIKAPVLVEDGGFSVFSLNGFPGVYTKYVLKTLGADGILRLMQGNNDRRAKFISVATYVNEEGKVFQFEREGGEFEISENKVDKQSPFAWSELWKIIYLQEYGKNLCELSEQEVSEYYGSIGANGSIQKFVKWYADEYRR
uniref:Non-canonical purine NTP pyrophosphatase n=1 Tax=uncultured Alphaproteobacteria bacterium TaxID=91750 RepID=A0A6G8F2H7_9PROT|nr:hypothetical protein PlAlph_3180 [uncultured Alphaproteobacteria bacterium]